MDKPNGLVTKTDINIERIANTDWRFASRNIDDDFHTDIVFLRVSVRKMHEFTDNVSHNQALLHYKGFSGEFYYPNERSKYVCQKLINRLIKEPAWGDIINNQIYLRAEALENVWEKLPTYINFSKMSDYQLKSFYQAQLDSQIMLYQVAWIPETLQTYTYGLTDYLLNWLGEKVSDDVARGEFFQILTASDRSSIYFDQERDLLDLVINIKSSDELSKIFDLPIKYLRLYLPSSINKKIFDLINKYSCLGYHGYGGRRTYDFDYYLYKLVELVKDTSSLNQLTINMKMKRGTSSQKRKVLKQLEIDHKLAEVFRVYSDFAVSKARRRLAQLKNFYYLDQIILEFATRFGVSESIVRFMMPEEIIGSLENRITAVEDLEKRVKEMVYFVNTASEKRFIKNNTIRRLMNNIVIADNIPVKNRLYGIPVCGGHVIGKAITLLRLAESTNLLLDDDTILVSIEADPDLLPIMIKSKAIVTDQGGITCHAAVIAKEFNIPCVTGTQFATRFIRQGDLIEVDADRGIVTILERIDKNVSRED